MAYIDERMPQRLVAGFTFGPRWKTLRTPLANGREKKDAKWQFPKFEGRGKLAAWDEASLASLLDFAMVSGGAADAFRVRIPTYCTATNQPLVTVAGTTYLSRAHTVGGRTRYKLVQAPTSATLSGAGSVDMDTGIVTGAAPGDTWTGQFDLWMSFDEDFTPFTAVTMGVWEQDVTLVEVRR